MTGLLIRDAEVDGTRRCDVRIRDRRVVELGLALRRDGEDELPAGGAALLPGLVDHHLHLHALAAAAVSVDCRPARVPDRAALAAALATAETGADGWVRATGWSERATGDLDGEALDRLHGGRPVRLQHRSGALWVVNTAGAVALELAGADHPGIERDDSGRPTGRLWRADDWVRSRLGRAAPPDLAGVGRRLSRFGITAVTDATPDLDPVAAGALATARATGALPVRVHVLGLPLGPPAPPGLTTGPAKVVLPDSGLPDLDCLVRRISTTHAAGRAVAVHVVTREALALLLAALSLTGVRPGDRLEHAALVPPEVVADLAARGLAVVTQPGFLADRGDDYLLELPPGDVADLYRSATLLDAGIPVALSSDAPYGPLDPWAVLAAGVRRRTPAGTVVGAHERLAPVAALGALLAPPEDPGGAPRRVTPGSVADLVLLDRPLAGVLADPHAGFVVATVLGGTVVHRGDGHP